MADLNKSFASEEDLGKAFAAEKDAGKPSALETAGQSAEDLARSALEGSTLGYSGELLGGMQAGAEKAGDVLKGQKGKDFLDLYKQYHKEHEDALKTAYERSPTLSTVGEVGGMVLPALATAGAGTVVGGTKAAIQAAAKAGPAALAKLMGKGAVSGAVLGGVAAGGKSEGSIAEDPEKLKEDVLSGAETGGIIGGALPLATVPLKKGITKVGEYAEEYAAKSPLLRQAKKAFRMGKAGDIIEETDPFRTKTALQETDAIQGLTSKILTADEALGKTFGQVIDDATQKGTKIALGEPSVKALQSVQNVLKNNEVLNALPESGKFAESLGKVLSGNDLTPREALDLKQYVKSITNKIDVPGLKQVGTQLSNDIDSVLGTNVPGFNEINGLFSRFREAVPESMIGGTKYLGQMSPAVQKEKLTSAVTKMLEGVGMPGSSKRGVQRDFTELMENIKALEKDNPGLLESLGIAKNPTAFEKGIRNQADQFALVHQGLGFAPKTGLVTNTVATLTGSPASTGRGLLLDYSNRLGNVTRMLKPSVDSGKKLYSAPESVLQALGKTLEESGVPGMSNVGTSLLRGLSEKNSAMKNAALFSIMQNPEARLHMNKFIPSDEEESASATQTNKTFK